MWVLQVLQALRSLQDGGQWRLWVIMTVGGKAFKEHHLAVGGHILGIFRISA